MKLPLKVRNHQPKMRRQRTHPRRGKRQHLRRKKRRMKNKQRKVRTHLLKMLPQREKLQLKVKNPQLLRMVSPKSQSPIG